ncbi:hypothetical protein ACXC9Q_07945 [Kribbella sp. CWNU-51]
MADIGVIGGSGLYTFLSDAQTVEIDTPFGPPSEALPHQPSFAAYNVGGGTIHTIGDVAAELSRAYDGPAPVVTGQYRLGDVRHITASSDRLHNELGWKPACDLTTDLADLLSNARG